ncbi:MAG: hypothetical protein A2W18_07325 [Candidatus Muproteobacteria bacterium RBG_16_60_9]|uniref:AttH domain-containing protein n=1 Tax=Candidatus Muproteobacteria bacterium RBG_16_60_9 TaxID=1817755 RepID=A0A1F6V324_9PROT|nr:MAG: hypothetical protein A2W18_07325 [Candidatus Muproteobacteria bacterium RBG_16_60_9]
MIERERWNRCRIVEGDARGHYESYFQRANHPKRPLAFWIRYTVFSPKGRSGDAVGELWAIYFDGERECVTAVKEVVPMRDCRFGERGLDVRIGDASLTDGQLQGSASSGGNALQWDLRYTGDEPPLLLLPESFYERSFPKAKALVGTPNAVFDGAVSVNGAAADVRGWVGSQNHNWGSKHTDSYAWGQVAGFDGAPRAFLECSTARLKLGPFWTPPMTVVVLRLEDEEIRLNSLAQAFRAHGDFDFVSWRFETHTDAVRLRATMHAPKSLFVGLTYNNPPGGSKTCLNTKLAACELTVERTGQAPRTLTTSHRAAFEILTDRQDHGVPIAA